MNLEERLVETDVEMAPRDRRYVGEPRRRGAGDPGSRAARGEARPTVLTVHEVRGRVRAVRRAARSGDDEAAASLERDLWEEVLGALAAGGCEVAGEALATVRMEFRRG